MDTQDLRGPAGGELHWDFSMWIGLLRKYFASVWLGWKLDILGSAATSSLFICFKNSLGDLTM